MLAHNLKQILTIVPEAFEMVKKANLEEEFPVDSKDSTTASYLRVHYLTKTANRKVDVSTQALVEKAASLYGVKDMLDKFVDRFNQIEKKASAPDIKTVEAGFEGDLGGMGFLYIEKAAAAAERIYDTYSGQVKSEQVLKYSGNAYLKKEAAVQALANRYYGSKDAEFVKVAKQVVGVKEDDYPTIREICKSVTQLDKKAGFDIIGFNFYNEALTTKVAELMSAMCVTLAGEDVPYTKILNFGKDRIGATLGPDVSAGMTGDPVNDKAVLESLPRDLQITLKALVKSN